jgi:hypothetical protein
LGFGEDKEPVICESVVFVQNIVITPDYRRIIRAIFLYNYIPFLPPMSDLETGLNDKGYP